MLGLVLAASICSNIPRDTPLRAASAARVHRLLPRRNRIVCASAATVSAVIGLAGAAESRFTLVQYTEPLDGLQSWVLRWTRTCLSF